MVVFKSNLFNVLRPFEHFWLRESENNYASTVAAGSNSDMK